MPVETKGPQVKDLSLRPSKLFRLPMPEMKDGCCAWEGRALAHETVKTSDEGRLSAWAGSLGITWEPAPWGRALCL